MSLPTDAAARKAIPIYSGFIKYFPDAIAAVAELSRIGNEQHSPGKPLHWDRSKSGDEMDALMRHLIDDATGVPVDTDGVEHLTKTAWRAMAALQKLLERGKAPAVTKKGWQTHDGVTCPVADDVIVEVQYENGVLSQKNPSPARVWCWKWDSPVAGCGDILKWRHA